MDTDNISWYKWVPDNACRETFSFYVEQEHRYIVSSLLYSTVHSLIALSSYPATSVIFIARY